MISSSVAIGFSSKITRILKKNH